MATSDLTLGQIIQPIMPVEEYDEFFWDKGQFYTKGNAVVTFFYVFPKVQKRVQNQNAERRHQGGGGGATVIVPNPKYILSQVIQAENQQRRFQRW